MRKPIRLFAMAIILATANATTVFANVPEVSRVQPNQAVEVAHAPVELPPAGNVNPDILRDLFVNSILIKCEEQKCVNVAAGIPYPITEEGYAEGYSVVIEGDVLERNKLSKEQLWEYYPWLSDLYQILYKDLP